MAGKRRRRLTDASVVRLTPAAREYTVWDTRHAGLGVRVRPSGHRSFVYCRKGASSGRITLGSAALMSVDEARADCLAVETSARAGQTERAAVPTFEAFCAGPVRAHFERRKPSTQKSVRWMLNGRLLPAFGPLPLDRITSAAVHRWFDEYSRTAPGGANCVLSVLRNILNQAVDAGHIKSNPAQAVRRNPRPRLTRFLSCEEVRRLHLALDRHVDTRPAWARQADVIRLLLLTGCRRGEIVNLRWQDIEGDTLKIADGKTGPRTVYLSAPARAILERQPREGSVYVFPSPFDQGRPLWPGLPLWRKVRKEAGIEDVRIHDLRHTVASHAVLQGIPLPAVSRLLGHKRPGMTLRYAHVGDRETEAAAERIGLVLGRLLHSTGSTLEPPCRVGV